MSHRLQRSARLRSSEDFRRVFQEGHRVEGSWMKLYVAASPGGRNRIALSCERGSFRTHVLRNRAKRRLRECYRLVQEQLQRGFDMILVAKKGMSEEPPFEKLRAEFLTLAREAGILIGRT